MVLNAYNVIHPVQLVKTQEPLTTLDDAWLVTKVLIISNL